MRKSVLLIISLLTAGAAQAAVHVSLDLPRTIEDAKPVQAAVTITNNGSDALKIVPSDVRLAVTWIEQAAPKPCFMRRYATVNALSDRSVTIQPGRSERLMIDLLRDYPTGLPLGRYSVTAVYLIAPGNSVRSEPAALNVIKPTGAADYDAFTVACAAFGRAISRESGMSRDQRQEDAAIILDFARNHPRFLFARVLLERAMLIADEPERGQIAELLMNQYPGTEEAEGAAIDVRRMRERKESLAGQREVDTAWSTCAESLARPENASAAAAVQQLGSILDDAGWVRYENFLSRFPTSCYAPEALYSMIAAAENGILPHGHPAAERDTFVKSLLQRLAANYPNSARAKELSRKSPQ